MFDRASLLRRVLVVVLTAGLVATACSSDDDSVEGDDATTQTETEDGAEGDTGGAASSEPDPDDGSGESAMDAEVSEARSNGLSTSQVEAIVAEAATIDANFLPDTDAGVPDGIEAVPGGAPGYTRYVFRDNGTEVVPTLVEGPLGTQYRCQEVELPCSYNELKELADSDAEPPEAMGMTADEVDQLVVELDQLNAAISPYADENDACADGFVSDRIQSPNMGTHFYQPGRLADGFDPSQPEILLYARANGDWGGGPVGQCVDGAWVGDDLKLVGSSFIISANSTDGEHPEGFTGPLDNWHIHYNLCRGNSSGRDSFVSEEECRAGGGNWSPQIGWMIHAWADPEHDNDFGIFSMWNPRLAPVMNAADQTELRDTRQVTGNLPEGAEASPITNFEFDDVTVEAGQTIQFTNNDSVPHTVTDAESADAAFDSGVFAPGEAYEVSFDDPGEYSIFCALHPDMVGTVTVSG